MESVGGTPLRSLSLYPCFLKDLLRAPRRSRARRRSSRRPRCANVAFSHAQLMSVARVGRSNPDISTLEKTRHFYVGLTKTRLPRSVMTELPTHLVSAPP